MGCGVDGRMPGFGTVFVRSGHNYVPERVAKDFSDEVVVCTTVRRLDVCLMGCCEWDSGFREVSVVT